MQVKSDPALSYINFILFNSVYPVYVQFVNHVELKICFL